jgi:hypothetical protein
MDITALFISQDVIFGHGSDDVGQFKMKGKVDLSSTEFTITK